MNTVRSNNLSLKCQPFTPFTPQEYKNIKGLEKFRQAKCIKLKTWIDF